MPLDTSILDSLTPVSPPPQAASVPSYPMVAPHPAPDGQGWTNLSDEDYAKFNAGIPPPSQPKGDAKGGASTSILDSLPPVHAAPAAPQSTLSGMVANMGAGTSDRAASALGAPVDLATGAINLIPRGINAVAGTHIPTIQNPVGGSESIKSAFGLIGADPRNVKPQGAPEELARAAGSGAASMVLPWAGARALPALAGVPGAVQSAMGGGSAAGQAAVGATAGVGGQAAEDAVPEPYKPLANMGGQIVAGGIPAAAGAVGKALGGAVVNKVGDFLAPTTAAGQKRVAAQTYFGPAHDLDSVADTLNNPPALLVDGSQPTTYQLTDDRGLGAVERAAAKGSPDAFLQMSNDQNAARVRAAQGLQAGGDPHGVGDFLRQQLADADAADEGVRQGYQQQAQAKTQALGNAPPVGEDAQRSTLQRFGDTIRGGLDTLNQGAKARVSKLYDAIDPDGTLALDMGAFRGAVKDIAKDRRQNAKPLQGEAGAVFGVAQMQPKVQKFSEVAALRTRVGDAMAAIRGNPEMAEEYRQLTRLRGALDDALVGGAQNRAAEDAQAVASGQMAPEASIMGRLQSERANGAEALGTSPTGSSGGVVGNNAGGGQAGSVADRGAAVQGQGRSGNAGGNQGVAPAPADVAPLKGPNRKPESLWDAIIRLGGVKDWSGELKSQDLDLVHHRAGGRLINPNGMDGDYMRMAVRDEGFPVGDTMASFGDAVRMGDRVFRPEDDYEAMSRRQASTQAYQEEQARYDARDAVAQSVDAAGVRVSPAELDHATDLVMQGAHPDDALHQALSATEDEVLQRNAARNANGSPGMPLAEQPSLNVEGSSGLTPNFTEADLAKKRAADAAHADRMQTFGPKVPGVGPVLGKGARPGEFAMPASQVAANLFMPGAGAAERIQAAVKAAAGNSAILDTIKDYAAFSLRRAAEESDGTLNPAKAQRWLDAHAEALTAFPDLKAKFADAVTARKTLDDVAAKQQANRVAYQTAAVSKLMGDADPVRAVGNILRSDTAEAQMQDLARKTAGAPDARAGLRRAVVEYMLNELRGNALAGDERAFKNDVFQTFARKASPALRAIFSPEEIQNIQNIAADLQQAQKSYAGTKLPGGSNTAQDLAAGARHGRGGQSVLSQLIMAEIAGDMAHGGAAALMPHGGFLAHGVGTVTKLATVVLNAMRASGFEKIDQMVTEAARNPAFAKLLLAHMPKNEAAAKSLSRVIADQMKTLGAVGAVTSGRDEQLRKSP